MGNSSSTINKSTLVNNKIDVNVDLDQVNQTATTTIVKTAQEISKSISVKIDNENSIKFKDIVTAGDLYIGPINMKIDSVILTSAFSDSSFDSIFMKNFKQDLANDMSGAIAGTYSNDIVDKFKNNVTSNADVIPQTTKSEINGKTVIDTKVASNISSLMLNCFTDCFESDTKQILKEEILFQVKNSNELSFKNIVVGGTATIAGASLSISSNVIFKVVSRTKLANLIVHEIGNSINNIVNIKETQNAGTAVQDEIDAKAEGTSGIKGLTDIFTSLFSMPVKLLAVLMVGFVCIFGIAAAVIIFGMKYLFGSPEALSAVASAVTRGLGDLEKNRSTFDYIQNLIDNNSLIQSSSLLEF